MLSYIIIHILDLSCNVAFLEKKLNNKKQMLMSDMKADCPKGS